MVWEGSFDRKVKKKKKEEVMVLPHVIFWSIWRERNRRVFDNVETPLQRLKRISSKFSSFGRMGSSTLPFLIWQIV